MRFHALIIRIALSKVKGAARLGVSGFLLAGALGTAALAAFELDSPMPRVAGMGGAGIALAGDAWSMQRNPALVAQTDPQLGAAWSQQFGLPELGTEAVCVIGRIKSQPWALGGTTFGSDLYRESKFSLGLARQLPSSIAVGIEVSGQWLQIQNYGQGQALAFSAGLAVRPLDKVTIGAAWKNLNDPRIGGYRDRIAESLIAGVAVQIADEGLMAVDVVQEAHFRAEYRLGAEAKVLRSLWIRVGAQAEPVRPSTGIEVAVRRWHFVYAVDLHPDLGASHQVGLSAYLR